MTALELKAKFLRKSQLHKVSVIGHLSAIVVDGKDSWYHIHDDKEIPHNAGISFHIRQQYQGHWRDEVKVD